MRCFGFPLGTTAQEVAAEARQLGLPRDLRQGGRGDELDTGIVRQIRAAIGPGRFLPLDPNEHRKSVRASRRIRRLLQYDVEPVERPTHAESLDALARVQAASPVASTANRPDGHGDSPANPQAAQAETIEPTTTRRHNHPGNPQTSSPTQTKQPTTQISSE